jgi:hypothetical protein
MVSAATAVWETLRQSLTVSQKAETGFEYLGSQWTVPNGRPTIIPGSVKHTAQVLDNLQEIGAPLDDRYRRIVSHAARCCPCSGECWKSACPCMARVGRSADSSVLMRMPAPPRPKAPKLPDAWEYDRVIPEPTTEPTVYGPQDADFVARCAKVNVNPRQIRMASEYLGFFRRDSKSIGDSIPAGLRTTPAPIQWPAPIAAVLHALGRGDKKLTLREIMTATGRTNAECRRSLSTLRTLGYVRLNEDTYSRRPRNTRWSDICDARMIARKKEIQPAEAHEKKHADELDAEVVEEQEPDPLWYQEHRLRYPSVRRLYPPPCCHRVSYGDETHHSYMCSAGVGGYWELSPEARVAYDRPAAPADGSDLV